MSCWDAGCCANSGAPNEIVTSKINARPFFRFTDSIEMTPNGTQANISDFGAFLETRL